MLFAIIVALGAAADPADRHPGHRPRRQRAQVRAGRRRTTSRRTSTLRKLEEDYDITDKLQEEAGKLPSRLGGAAGTLRDIGLGLVNSLFALITILALTAFMLGSGRNGSIRH